MLGRQLGNFWETGTLARVPLVGGAPRSLADNVLAADWGPDGAVALVRQVGEPLPAGISLGAPVVRIGHVVELTSRFPKRRPDSFSGRGRRPFFGERRGPLGREASPVERLEMGRPIHSLGAGRRGVVVFRQRRGMELPAARRVAVGAPASPAAPPRHHIPAGPLSGWAPTPCRRRVSSERDEVPSSTRNS